MTSREEWNLVAPDGTMLGRLEVLTSDMPWRECRFTATPAFDEYEPLFRAERKLLEDDRMSEWPAAYDRIHALGLSLQPVAGGSAIETFLLHVNGERARLRY